MSTLTSNPKLSPAELVFQLAQLEAILDIRIGDIPAAQIIRTATRMIEKLTSVDAEKARHPLMELRDSSGMRDLMALLVNAVEDTMRSHPEELTCCSVTRIRCAAAREFLSGNKTPSNETGAHCVHPLGALFHHGFVSGKLHDYRCNLCDTVVNIPGLDSRIWAAARVDFQDARPVCPQCGQINGFHRETCPLRHSEKAAASPGAPPGCGYPECGCPDITQCKANVDDETGR